MGDLMYMPFPYVRNGKRVDGLTHPWPSACLGCKHRQCEDDESEEIGLCSYGYNYMRIDDLLLVAGVVVRDYPTSTKARAKALKAARAESIPSEHLRAISLRASARRQHDASQIEREKARVLREYRESEGYRADTLELLKPSLEQAFAQVHDYRRLTTLVIQNINVLLEQSHPGLNLEEQLRLSERPIRSMYWAARLMEFKLESALFMVHPERIDDPARRRLFRFHGLVRKYIGIYEAQMATRRITCREQGQSFGQLNENPDAVGVIPNAFIDNAIKYAPTGSEVVFSFSEDASTIRFSVGSLGPRINKADMEHVFDLFYRAPAAIQTSEDGTGFGLALAQHVADRIEANLEVTQDGHEQSKGFFWTTFSAELKKRPQEEGTAHLYRARGRVPGGARPTA